MQVKLNGKSGFLGVSWVKAWLAHLNTGRKLFLAFGVIFLMFGSAAAFTYWQLVSLERDMRVAMRSCTEINLVAAKMHDSVQSTLINALLVSTAQTKDDVNFYVSAARRTQAQYADAKKQLLEVTHGGKDIEGMSKALETVVAAEIADTFATSVVDRGKDTVSHLGDGETLSLDADQISEVTSTFKDQMDFWVKSVDGIAAVLSAFSADRQLQTERSAFMARQVLVGAALTSLLVGAVAAWLIARSVSRPLRQAVQAAERVATGDLSGRIELQSQDEMGILLQSLSRMQDSLHHVVADVRDSAHAIESASSEVAMGNLDLSQRTETASGHLQQTHAALRQLESLVHDSTEAAQRVNRLAGSAADAVDRGGQVMQQVVDSMESIAVQSRKIAEITGVIDAISFQTNILALNAAVEAARAGEQGRGFAVVASEVRSLARRSAEAARDIKTLIDSSRGTVDSGVALVQKAGSTMADVVVAVREVNHTIDTITRTSGAQRQGIDEVSTAMEQLDHMTQQNAALVEQSAAAAGSLKAQAQRLTQLVASFN